MDLDEQENEIDEFEQEEDSTVSTSDLEEESSSTNSEESTQKEMGAEHSEASAPQTASPRTRRVTFNKDLPATHSYLGQDMEDVGGGQTVIDSESVIDNVPLFPVRSMILMPGQTLPLQSLHPRAISMFRNIIERHTHFAVISLRYGPEMDMELSKVGTLAQVLAFKEQTDHEVTALKIKAVGRQRFELLETRRGIDGTSLGKVRILPETDLPSALNNAELSCRRRHLKPVRLSQRVPATVYARKYDKYFASVFTPNPRQVYKQFDVEEMVSELVSELSKWYDADRVRRLSANRVEFSYWVASNLPIDDPTKLELLQINCCTQRFRAELSLLRGCDHFVCRSCNTKICAKSDVFSMSVDGPMGAYVNPGGFVHEMLTLLKVENALRLHGGPETQNSWFPGYAWTILECLQCSAHMGWRFTATEKGLKPSKFWGITRTAILPSMDQTLNQHKV